MGLWGAVFWLLWASGASAQNSLDLDECENLGIQAGQFAYLGPCAKLKLTCPSPTDTAEALDGRSISNTTVPAFLETEVTRTTCTILFQSACKKSAIDSLFSSDDRICKDILTNPPPPVVYIPESCKTFRGAVQIFKDSLSTICHRQPTFIRNYVDRLVSEGKPAFQSTTLAGYEGSKAVDGVLRTSRNCTSTGFIDSREGKLTTSPWWAVDLEAEWNVTRVRITAPKRNNRLFNFEIRVSSTTPLGDGTTDPIGDATVCKRGLKVPRGKTKEFKCTASGRFVVIRITGERKVLSLCEVQVYARVDDRPTLMKNVVLSTGKPTFQVSTALNGVSSRAVDGSKDADYTRGSCTRTGFNKRRNYSFSPWWAVDLEQVQTVTGVRITTRSDCCHIRLRDFEIRLGNEKPEGTGNQNEVCATGSTIPRGETFQFNCKGKGRYVSIRIPGRNAILTLCEVEVLG